MKVARFFVFTASVNLVLTLIAMAVAPYIVVPGVQLPAFQGLSWIPTLPSTSLVLYYQIAAFWSVFSAFGLAFGAWQSLARSVTIQDQRFFIDVTVRTEHVQTISEEMRSRAAQRQGVLATRATDARTSKKMQEVTELAADITTQLEEAERYEAIAKSVGKFQLATT